LGGWSAKDTYLDRGENHVKFEKGHLSFKNKGAKRIIEKNKQLRGEKEFQEKWKTKF